MKLFLMIMACLFGLLCYSFAWLDFKSKKIKDNTDYPYWLRKML